MRPALGASAGLGAGATAPLAACPRTQYRVECWDAHGALRWVDEFDNLVTTEGKNTLLDYTFKTGSGGTPAWYVGLVDASGFTGYAAGDTMGSHSGWAESTAYSDTTRRTFTPGTISGGSVDNAAAKAVFNINGTATIRGCFLTSNSTKGGTSGLLYGVGDFSGGTRSVVNGDTLNVTVTIQAT